MKARLPMWSLLMVVRESFEKKKICYVVASADHKIDESSEWEVLGGYRFCVIDIIH